MYCTVLPIGLIYSFIYVVLLHFRSLIGAGLSQFKSESLKINLPFFERFRNSEDRYMFSFRLYTEIVLWNPLFLSISTIQLIV